MKRYWTSAISLPFNLHCKANAALFFIPYYRSIWDIAKLFPEQLSSTCDVHRMQSHSWKFIIPHSKYTHQITWTSCCERAIHMLNLNRAQYMLKHYTDLQVNHETLIGLYRYKVHKHKWCDRAKWVGTR